MALKLYIKKEYIKNYNENNEYKILDEECTWLRDDENQTLVSLHVDNKFFPYITRYIPNKYLMKDYKNT